MGWIVHYTIRLIALSAALITLTLMIYLARPWGDNYAYQSLSGYAWLLGFAVWAILPYLMILFLVRRAFQSQENKLIVMMGALIIAIGGVALYVDAALLHRDPQGALVFIAVPFYQWIILGLLAGFHFLLSQKQSS
jgi:hypothetical protein